LPKLTVTLITLNAARQLEACLASVRDWADEIVVLDSGSTDGTVELAESFGARIIVQPWLGFGPQKNAAVEAASNDWVLCLDADERVSPPLAQAIRGLGAEPTFRAYRFARANRFMGRTLRHGEGYPDWSLRLFHRKVARWSDDTVHEKVITHADVGTLAGDLMHESAESLSTYLTKQNRYTDLQAEALAASTEAIGAKQVVLAPLVRFFKFYVVKQGFRDGLPGFVHIAIGCMNTLMKYAKAMQRRADASAPKR
jgi:glycosyltransferase involved in cell wall biosynthesis